MRVQATLPNSLSNRRQIQGQSTIQAGAFECQQLWKAVPFAHTSVLSPA